MRRTDVRSIDAGTSIGFAPTARTPSGIVDAVRVLAREWDRANGPEAFPADRLRALDDAGALTGFTMLTMPGAVEALDRVLRLVGGADLSLGRIYEGHVNAAQLVSAYGDDRQRAALTDGRVAGVWNTEPEPGMTIAPAGDGRWRLGGAKSFATGGGFIDDALITARRPDGAKQLVLVDIAGLVDRSDNEAWRVRGMRGTGSGLFDFDGMIVGPEALIGAPGDYEREPRFSAGAWRFTAVQLGAAEALVRHMRDHLIETGKGVDPVQRRRFADCVVAVRSAGDWVRRAALSAEAADPRAIPFVLMTRGVVEEAGLLVMEAAARGVGTASFFEGSRIDRITRDLGLYLRQPAPDQARDRAAAAWLEADCWSEGDGAVGDLWW
ncbi:acyl-CoA dehydrogenase [uncultured Sphingomonas sp.]|uniref:acyl-CoA dehydrogenase n=1 Tax=uncultured Sphingomonas sp. TaxID=158754 RepID=UPI0035CADAA2